MNRSTFPVTLVGHGPETVIVAHGWMGDQNLFKDFVPLIDTSRFTYAFFDCRGYGNRRTQGGPFTVEGIAEDVATAAADLGWDRFHVLGHSMGGMAAQKLMAERPERLRSVILLAPVPASGARIDEDRRALLTKALHSPEMRRTLIDANTGRRQSAEWLDDLLDLSLSGTDPDAMDAYMASWTGAGFLDEVRGSEVPVRVLMGELDPGTPPDHGRSTFLQWYPNASVEVLAGVGHYPMLEQPAALRAAIAKSIQS